MCCVSVESKKQNELGMILSLFEHIQSKTNESSFFVFGKKGEDINNSDYFWCTGENTNVEKAEKT